MNSRKSSATPQRSTRDCCGQNGQPKRRYETKADADQMAVHLRATEGVNLRVYACPYSSGWHLTKALAV